VVDRAFGAAGHDRQVPFEVAGSGAAADLVRNGLGIAFLPAPEAARISDLATVQVSGARADLARLGWRPRRTAACRPRHGRSSTNSSGTHLGA
jgi:DNA-binding transcriptional LysR family regulator